MPNKSKSSVFKLFFKNNLYTWEIKVNDLENISECAIYMPQIVQSLEDIEKDKTLYLQSRIFHPC